MFIDVKICRENIYIKNKSNKSNNKYVPILRVSIKYTNHHTIL